MVRRRAHPVRPAGALLRSAVLCLIGVASPSAWAASTAETEAILSDREEAIDQVARRTLALEQQVAPGRDRPEDRAILQRYEDAVYVYLIGEYANAAEEFFALVTTGWLVDLGLHWEAEWYLAESLFEMGSPEVAEATYRRIMADRDHPFRDDAVRRLLEIYSRDVDAARFDALYRDEILGGGVTPSDLIRYSVGKAFQIKGDIAKARSYFTDLGPESPFHLRAQYYLGAMLVEEGTEASLQEALAVFGPLAEAEVSSPDDRRVRDLSLLALGRIHYEFGSFQRAVEAYAQVGSDSAYLDEKLHELTWTFIKQGEYRQALDAVEVFLLAYPDHRYAADLQLVRGHLLFVEEDYERALEAYEDVVDAYTPVTARFAELARAGRDNRAYFEELLALDEDDLYAPRGEDALPAYAVALMLADRDFLRAMAVYRDLSSQAEAIDEAEALVDELAEILGGTGGSDPVDVLRARASSERVRALREGARLLDIEIDWLATVGGDDVQAPLRSLGTRSDTLLTGVDTTATQLARVARTLDDALAEDADRAGALQDAKRRLDEARLALVEGRDTLEDEARTALALQVADLEAEVAGLEAEPSRATTLIAELDEHEARLAERSRALDSIRADLEALRPSAGVDSVMDPVAARLDALHQTVRASLDRLDTMVRTLSSGEDTELERIRDTFQAEAQAVRGQRGRLDSTEDEAEVVASSLVREKFTSLEELFQASVLGADRGIVNVHWSRLISVGEERKRVAEERNVLLRELERRFAFLQDKLGQ